jgi:hypothetical protein
MRIILVEGPARNRMTVVNVGLLSEQKQREIPWLPRSRPRKTKGKLKDKKYI